MFGDVFDGDQALELEVVIDQQHALNPVLVEQKLGVGEGAGFAGLFEAGGEGVPLFAGGEGEVFFDLGRGVGFEEGLADGEEIVFLRGGGLRKQQGCGEQGEKGTQAAHDGLDPRTMNRLRR